ncbi:hypothetical protein [Geoglobus acetivorans]|uniref:Uncharacterized protein n=1 Tax=Geoglobus acetivorans TaxID=565033 RepID=A0ABZ3H1H9_GEOAI|nr:hypothetical protein [Geoglobus acetivorans]
MNISYHGPAVIDDPEKFEFQDFVRNAVGLEVQRVFYFNKRLYIVDFETLHGIVEDKFIVVEIITYSAFTEVDGYRRWILYHNHNDSYEYTDRVDMLRGDTTIIPVVKTGDRFVRKLEEQIEKGRFRTQ